jgi:7TMR-DISM extracellular 2/7TM diverse intracellular signalling
MLKFSSVLCICLLYLAGGQSVLYADDVDYSILKIQDDIKSIDIGRYMKILVCEGKPSLPKIMRDSVNYPFQANPQDFLYFKASASNQGYWISFKLKNESPERKYFFLELDNPLVSELEFFETKEKIESHNHTGSQFEFSTRHVNHRNFIFRINLPAQDERTYYLYVGNKGMDTYIPCRIYTAEAYAENQYIRQLGLGITIGILGLILGIAIWMYLRLKQALFGFFSLYLCSMILWLAALTGLSFQFLWYNSPYWAERLVYLSCYLNVYAGMRVLSYFGKNQKYHPNIAGVLNWAGSISLALLLVSWMFFYFQSDWSVLLMGDFPFWCFYLGNLCLVGITAFSVFSNWQEENRLNIVASFLLFLGVLVQYFLAESTLQNPFTSTWALCLLVAVCLHSLLAISQRIRLLRNEEELAKLLSVNRLKMNNQSSEESNSAKIVFKQP